MDFVAIERIKHISLRILLTAVVVGGAIYYAESRSQEKDTSNRSDFVTLVNGDFSYEGRKFSPYGATFYPYWEHDGKITRGSSWSSNQFPTYIDTIVSMAKEAKLNTLRTTNYFDGLQSTDDPNWWKNPTVWNNMDYLMKRAADNNLFVLLDLSSFRDKLVKTGKYPYHAQDWNDFLTFIGTKYKDNHIILNYALAGEVPCPNSKNDLKPESTDALTQFYNQSSKKLHEVDPNHLISTGGLSYLNEKGCGIDWQSIFKLPTIGLTAIHVYSDGDRNTTVPLVGKWAEGHNKPFTVEEFGFKQDIGDVARADAYNQQYQLFKKYNAKTIIFWNMGTEVAPTSYEVSQNTPLTWNTVIKNSPENH